jgi:protein O-GlcNAc transferase
MKNTVQDSFHHLMSLAQRSHQKGDLAMAINLYKESLKIIPKHPDALQYLGIAYCSQQQYEQGIVYLEKAASLQPENPVLLTNLSNAYLKVEAYAKALPLLQQSVVIKPDFDEAWHKLANALKALDRMDEAIEAYQKTIALNPKHFNAYYNLGNTMLFLGNFKTAISLYETCLSIHPDFAPAHNNLGVVLLEWDRIDEAEQHYLKAIQLQANYTEAIKNVVALYSKSGKEAQANQWSQELLRINPDNQYLRLELESKAPIIPASNQDIDAYRHWVSSVLDKANPASYTDITKLVEYACYPSSELIYQGRTNKVLKEKHARLFDAVPKVKVEHVHEKPHVGFVVTSGHEGVFIKCMKGILNHIDTTKLDVSVVCSLPNGQKIIAPVLSNAAIRFVNLPSSFVKAQQTLVDAQFDVLHYWEIGTDATNYFLALTKPAKVQMTSWGWPTTSGLQSVDYFISQQQLELPHGQEHYTEKLVLLTKMPVYYYRPPVPRSPKTLAEYGLSSNKRFYICQQNLRKAHPDFDLLVAKLLEKDEEGMVLFIKDKQEAITAALQQRLSKALGHQMSRVVFMDRMPEEDYLGLLSQCSVALDTLHYGGGANTVYDAVEAGIPYITLEGNQHSARFASAALKQLEVVDTITYSVEDYVSKAIDIASNDALRKDIVARMKSNDYKLFEDLEAVRELEEFLLSVS